MHDDEPAPRGPNRRRSVLQPESDVTISPEDAERTARTLKALADPSRLRLLSIIATHDDGACVCDLTEPVGLSQPTVSHHLKVLTEAGFVTREQRGVWAYFSLVPGSLTQLVEHLTRHLGSNGPTGSGAPRVAPGREPRDTAELGR